MKSIGYIYKIKRTIVSFWKKNVPLFIRRGIASSNFTIITLVIITFSIGYIIVYVSNVPYLTFGIDNQEAKGKMLATYLSICGGITVLYGLYLNHKKLDEQTRQNDLEFKSNSDKRFGEAIGYLNSDNIGIAIGGVYTLFQLAREDERYTFIVANIFVQMLTHLTNINQKVIYNIIIDKLFSDTFNKVEITFRGLNFTNIDLQTAFSKRFEQCSFTDVEVSSNKGISFSKCTFNNVLLNNINNTIIEKCKIEKLFLQNIYSIKGLVLCNNDIRQCIINTSNILGQSVFDNNSISSYLEIKSRYLKDVTIINNTNVKLCSKTPLDIILKENNINCDSISYSEYDKMSIYYGES